MANGFGSNGGPAAFLDGSYDGDVFNIFIDMVGPEVPQPEPVRGIPLNAYKAFKTLNDFRGVPRIGYGI